MQKLHESVFSILKTTSLSSAVFSFLQPTEDFLDKTPLGGILRDTKYAWLALGPKFCVVDLRSGLKIAARTFGSGISSRITVTSVVEIPTPLTENSQQLIISLECDDITSLICFFHINGSQLLRCIQTDVVITQLTICDVLPNGPLMSFDGLVMAGTRKGEIIVFDLNRACLIQALKNISQGYGHLVRGESNVANLIFLPMKAVNKIENQRELAVENDDHLAILLNEDSFLDDQYIFRNPDGTVRMKAKQKHIRVTVAQYIPELGSLAVGFNFGAFQIWNLLNLDLEFTSQVNVECLPVTHFGFQEPCDDPRAFCYLWVVFSVLDRFEEEEFPLAVMYSLTYQGKRMLSDTKCLYQEFSMATIRFQIELSAVEDMSKYIGGRCISCHTYSISSTLGEEGEDTMLNLCQLVWECWGDNQNLGTQHGMLLFDLDQWYKDQMPATQTLQSNAFMSTAQCPEINSGSCVTLDLRLDPSSVSPYSHAIRLEEHFYPNSLQYDCVWLDTSEARVLHTVGVQRQIVRGVSAAGPACLLSPAPLHAACRAAGLSPLYADRRAHTSSQDEQRRFLLSVALEARLSRFLKRCAHDWATGTHSGVGCTLTFLVDWSWRRAIELKENAKELTAPLFTSSTVPDRNVVRCLEHCVQQLTQLTGLLDAILTKCCNLVVPDALSEMEEKYKGIGTVSLYFQVVQWFVRVGLLPERLHSFNALPYPANELEATYKKRRIKLHRLQDKSASESANESCALLYIDQLIENEFGGYRVHQMWIKAGSDSGGLYPPPSLYALLRLYLLPDIAEEHKHSLLLYLLLDYSMLYDDLRYEAVIRRLMQFPTMFGLSNTAIKATQAFWHLDHRDFDFALDQLQCLTGNTLSDWQHHVVLSSLLAQKKTQAALQYLHVRKPAPIQFRDGISNVNDHDKLNDWQSCCNLYLARGLIFEALDVIRMCVQNAESVADKVHLLNFFYKGCRNTGQLSKVLQVTLLPFEEEAFINYLKDCNEPQTSDLLVMYYLQQARYLEAERYNAVLRARGDADSERDSLVELLRASLPDVAGHVARAATTLNFTNVIKTKPMSVYVQAKSPENTFTYKSTFIQDTIENASETWINKPNMRKGLKRALNIEETPFICTPKLYKTKSLLNSEQKGSEATPPKRAKLDFSGTPRTPKVPCTLKVSESLSLQMASLLDMPEVESPHRPYDRAETPHSILKNRRLEGPQPQSPAPCSLDSDDSLDATSDRTHYSDTNKLLRFTIPTASESGSTPSPVAIAVSCGDSKDSSDKEMDYEEDATTSHMGAPHPMESPPKKFAAENKMQSRKSYKDIVKARRSLSISANSSLSDDPNTSIESIADIPITLINPRYSGEKKYTRTASPIEGEKEIEIEKEEFDVTEASEMDRGVDLPKPPTGRRSIRSAVGESTPLGNRSRPTTPERQDSRVFGRMYFESEVTRSRSPTPEGSPLALAPAPTPEGSPRALAPALSPARASPRSKSRTPERLDKIIKEPPRLEAIEESPSQTIELAAASPTRRSLRSRSRTPEVEIQEQAVMASPRNLRSRSRTPEVEIQEQAMKASPRNLRSRSRTPEVEIQEQAVIASPRSLRSRSKTPEKLMSPKKEQSTRTKKSLSRMVLEANAFAKTKQQPEKMEIESVEEKTESTPVKASKDVTSLMDFTFSPIVNKSFLHSSTESFLSITTERISKSNEGDSSLQVLPAFNTINETYTEKSVLHSYQSSIAETSQDQEEMENEEPKSDLKPLPAFTKVNEDVGKSVLHSVESSIAESSVEKVDSPKIPTMSFKFNESDIGKSVLGSNDNSAAITDDSITKEKIGESSLMTSDSEIEIKDWKEPEIQDTARVIQKEKEKIVEIEREINEIEGEMSDDCRVESDSSEEVAENSSESFDDESSDDDDSASENEIENEIISIVDSDESSEADNLQIDEQAPDTFHKVSDTEEVVIEEVIEEPVIDKSQNQIVEERQKNIEIEEISVVEDSNAQMNQARNISMLTDDNSDQSVSLNYSDENKADDNEAMETDPIEVIVTVEVPHPVAVFTTSKTVNISEDIGIGKPSEEVETVDVVDSCLTAKTPKQTDVEMGDEEITTDKKVQNKDLIMDDIQTDVGPAIETSTVIEVTMDNTQVSKNKDDSITAVEPIVKLTQQKDIKNDGKELVDTNKSEKTLKEPNVKVDDSQSASSARITKTSKEKDVDNKQTVKEKSAKEIESKREDEIPRNVSEPTQQVTKSVQEKKQESIQIEEKEKPARTRLRTKSTTSNKSIDEAEKDVPKTPSTRKRTQSTASNKSETEQRTPENITTETTTPTSRRRAKTPTSAEVRKIITRRASKELMDKGEEEYVIQEEVLTPRRRSTRSKSKKDDDNISVASESSVKTSRSKVSEDESKTQVRKGRKSILNTKPDLSVIPEVSTDETKSESVEEIANQLSTGRLTRNQKAILETWLEPQSPARRASATSRSELEDDDNSSVSSYDMQHVDRVNLMNKTDFEDRLARAASETKTIAKAARVTRRTSVDIALAQSPGAEGRARRASFARACEALHTPRRRPSTDTRGDSSSQQGSPPQTPARRASTASDSGTKGTGRKSRKTADKNKESEE